jgi:peroxiredoxin Q/BCP
MQITAGAMAPSLNGAKDLSGHAVSLAGSRGGFLLLVFLRYAACPMCLLRLGELCRRYGDLQRAGVDVVAVFHSPRGRIVRHTRSHALPFRAVADPEFALYERYGVGRSWRGLARSVVTPSFYLAFVRALLARYWGGAIDSDIARMPADFLVSPAGIVVAAHRGRHIGDHLPVDDVLRMVAAPDLAESAPRGAQHAAT